MVIVNINFSTEIKGKQDIKGDGHIFARTWQVY